LPTNFEWLRPNFEGGPAVVSVTFHEAAAKLDRDGRPPVVLGFVQEDLVTAQMVRDLLTQHADVTFVVIVKRSGRIDGPAIGLCRELGLGWGHVADAMRASRDMDQVSDYEWAEHRFVRQGLERHDSIVARERVEDLVWELTTRSGRTVRAVIESGYQPTVDSVRNAIDVHGEFDVFVSTNPNVGPTPEAVEFGRSAGIQVLRWGPFLGSLN
jgi:hypothetical protein